MNAGNPTTARHIMIGGAPKAGTTSLFNYLAAHPDINASRIKETRYFLDPDYPIPDYAKQTGDSYAAYFETGNPGARLESTPLYMYSPGTPERVRETLGEGVHWIFILRDPVERFLSWYDYTREIGWLEQSVGLETFARRQLGGEVRGEQSLVYAGLEHGLYAQHLQPFLASSGAEHVSTVWFETLKSRPADALDNICARLDLDAGFYSNFEWPVHNATRMARFPAIDRRYRVMARNLRLRVLGSPRLHNYLRQTVKSLSPLLKPVLYSANSRAELPDDLRQELYEYYAGPNDALEQLLGEPVPSGWAGG